MHDLQTSSNNVKWRGLSLPEGGVNFVQYTKPISFFKGNFVGGGRGEGGVLG